MFLFISGIMTFSTGIGLTIVRLFEPLFRYLMIVKMYEFWGEIYEPDDRFKENEKRVANDALSSFLSSSLNVELVYVLLSSITTFSKRAHNAKDDPSLIVQARNDAAKEKLVKAYITPINFATS